MYQRSSGCTVPEDTVRVWRYMTFTKFMSLVDRSALYFARVDRLGDPFEGSYGRRNLTGDLRQEEMAPAYSEKMPGGGFRGRVESVPMSPEQRRAIRSLGQRRTYANCWHMNDCESAAMWSVYSRSGEGIAIQSTFRRLRESFISPDHDQRVSISVVKYFDHEIEAVPETNIFMPYLHKKRSFDFEHELRVLCAGVGGSAGEGGLNPETFPTLPGKYIDVSLSTLIECVYVAPKSPGWLTELVQSVVAGVVARYEFGREVAVINSRLDDPALY